MVSEIGDWTIVASKRCHVCFESLFRKRFVLRHRHALPDEETTEFKCDGCGYCCAVSGYVETEKPATEDGVFGFKVDPTVPKSFAHDQAMSKVLHEFPSFRDLATEIIRLRKERTEMWRRSFVYYLTMHPDWRPGMPNGFFGNCRQIEGLTTVADDGNRALEMIRDLAQQVELP